MVARLCATMILQRLVTGSPVPRPPARTPVPPARPPARHFPALPSRAMVAVAAAGAFTCGRPLTGARGAASESGRTSWARTGVVTRSHVLFVRDGSAGP